MRRAQLEAVLRELARVTGDLAVSKLAAGRLKDNEMVAALLHGGLVQVETLRERILEAPEARMRAVLLARLQIVLESLG